MTNQYLSNELSTASETASPIVVPVLEEKLHVSKAVVETGQVRVRKEVHNDTLTLDLPTTYQTVDVERVPVNRVVDEAPQARYEGDTLVIPVVREEVVTVTRLVLVEEIRLKNQYRTEVVSQPVTLRREEVVIDRVDAPRVDVPRVDAPRVDVPEVPPVSTGHTL